jgi:hypothetical protein
MFSYFLVVSLCASLMSDLFYSSSRLFYPIREYKSSSAMAARKDDENVHPNRIAVAEDPPLLIPKKQQPFVMTPDAKRHKPATSTTPSTRHITTKSNRKETTKEATACPVVDIVIDVDAENPSNCVNRRPDMKIRCHVYLIKDPAGTLMSPKGTNY